MGQRPYFNQGLIVHCLAFSVKMGINFCILLIVGFHCVSGNPLQEKRWGQAASNSAASNKNNIMIGRERRRRDGDKQLPTAMLLTPTISKLAKKRRKRKDGDKQLPTVMHPMPTIYKLAKRKKKKRDG